MKSITPGSPKWRGPLTGRQMALFAKAAETKKATTYMARSDEYDVANLSLARKILERPEKVTMPFYLVWARLVVERLDPSHPALARKDACDTSGATS